MRLAARRVIASATCRASSALPAAAGAIFLVLAAAEAAEAAGASFPALAAAVGGRLPTEPRRLLKSTSGCGAGRATADWERSRGGGWTQARGALEGAEVAPLLADDAPRTHDAQPAHVILTPPLRLLENRNYINLLKGA
jgi:hypothetical protein